MAKSADTSLEQLVAAVLRSRKYSTMSADLVTRLGAEELAKGRRLKDAIKSTKSKLHQVAGAYQTKGIDYTAWNAEIASRKHDSQALQEFYLRAMQQHASTRERLPIMSDFYQQIFARTGAISTILDLACGLNPLARAWMPIAPDTRYWACDIYQDQMNFLNHFFSATGTAGRAWVCDLLSTPQLPTADLILLLKAIPCLEQLDKSAVIELLSTLNAPHMVVSFPLQSIGGRGKGMLATYRANFSHIAQTLEWNFEEMHFDSELAYYITR